MDRVGVGALPVDRVGVGALPVERVDQYAGNIVVHQVNGKYLSLQCPHEIVSNFSY